VVKPVPFASVRAAPNQSRPLRERLAAILSQLVLAPSLLATFVYAIVFCGWTIWVSLSNSTLLPDYSISGFHHYVELWSNRALAPDGFLS
jgi:glucose/mannose transport system permease protein